ncbi:MAG: hypothetical protein ABIT01_07045 [Thermoanaerobaculia bacterium]
MKWLDATRRISLALLGTTALAVSAIPYFSSSALAGGGEGADVDETTISVRTAGDSNPTVIHVPELRTGESQTFTSDSGKSILLTRSEDGLRLKVGDKETLLSDHPEGDGESIVVNGSGENGEKKIIVLDHDGAGGAHDMRTKVIVTGKGNAYSCRTGTGELKVRGTADLLKGRNLKSLDKLDAGTRAAVVAALDELMTEGVIIAPMAELDAPPGENGVQIQVERKRTRR